MKRVLAGILLLAAMFALAACTDPSATEPTPIQAPTAPPTEAPTEPPTQPVDPLAQLRTEGWLEPEREDMADIQWLSETGYIFLLFLEPEGEFDGFADISYIDEEDNLIPICGGNWRLREGKLFLELEGYDPEQPSVRGEFFVLCQENALVIAPAQEQTLPFFREAQTTALLTVKPQKSYYEYLLENAWHYPQKRDLTQTGWMSYDGYALLLSEENGGTARLFRVQEDGTYVGAFLGSWSYREGILELELYHAANPAIVVEGAFPVLMLDGQLALFRTAEGRGLPYFAQDQEYDMFRNPEND